MKIKLKSFLGKAALESVQEEELHNEQAEAEAEAPAEAPAEGKAPAEAPAEVEAPAEGEAPAEDAEPAPSADDLPEATPAEKATAEEGGEVVESEQEESDEQMADAVSAELAQADVSEEIVTEVAEDSEELAAATEALLDTVSLINQANQNGGMDRFTSMAVRQSTNYVTSRLGLESLPLPAMEDMETPSAKIGAGTAAKNQIVAFIKRIMEAIASGFSRFKDWIVTLSKGLFNAWASIEKRATKIATFAGAAKSLSAEKLSSKEAIGFYFGDNYSKDLGASTDSFIKSVEFFNNPSNYKHWSNAVENLVGGANSGGGDGHLENVNTELSAFSKSILAATTDTISDELVKEAATSVNATVLKSHKTGSGYLYAPGANLIIIGIPTLVESIGFMKTNIMPLKQYIVGKSPVDRPDANSIKSVCEKIAAFAKKMQEDLKSNSGGILQLEKLASDQSKSMIAANKKIYETIANERAANNSEFVRKLAVAFSKFGTKTAQLPIYTVNKVAASGFNAMLNSCASAVKSAEPVKEATA